jgi:hypothetical protein
MAINETAQSFFHLHNCISCKGFDVKNAMDFGSVGLNFGECMQAKLFAVILFFGIALINKWGGEEMGIEFNQIAAYVGGLVSYFLIVTIIGMPKISFVIGLVVALVLGYGGGALLGGTETGSDY